MARCQNAASWPMWGGQRLVGYGDGPGGYQGDLWVGVRIFARKSYSGLGGCLTACFLDQHNQSCYCFACDLNLTKTARALNYYCFEDLASYFVSCFPASYECSSSISY